MNTTHTPGSWVVSPTKHRTLIVSEEGFQVAAVEEVNGADANLMSAAPDLLAALQAVLPYLKGTESFAAQEAQARAAIAKATGA